eukprot:1952415-Pyramimonas_sp.AAC.2
MGDSLTAPFLPWVSSDSSSCTYVPTCAIHDTPVFGERLFLDVRPSPDAHDMMPPLQVRGTLRPTMRGNESRLREHQPAGARMP